MHRPSLEALSHALKLVFVDEINWMLLTLIEDVGLSRLKKVTW